MYLITVFAGGHERLLAHGTRKVPLLARNGKYVFAGESRERRGIRWTRLDRPHAAASTSALCEWHHVLRAAQRYVRQMPEAALADRAIPNRDRAIRLVCHHVFRIAEAFEGTMTQGTEYWEWHAQKEPEPDTMLTAEEIARYADDVITRLERWWASLVDRSGRQPVKTYMGEQPMYALFERSAWHSAQHARQLVALLERYGTAPEGPLTRKDLAGLPLPERLWE